MEHAGGGPAATSAGDVLDALGQAVWATDLDGAVEYWNPAAAALAGWSAEKAVGRSIEELIEPLVGSTSIPQVMRMVQGGATWTGQLIIRHRDGERLPLHVEVSGRDADGQLAGFVLAGRPLRDHRDAGTIDDEEARFQRMVDAARGGLCLFDRAGIITYANPAMAELLGVRAGDLVGRAALDFIPDEDRASIQSSWAAYVPGTTNHRDCRVLRADGTTFWAEVVAEAIVSPEGEWLGMVGRFADLAERQRAFVALRDNEERFQRLFLESPVGMAVVGLDGIIHQANPALGRLLGYRPDELVGRTGGEFAHPDDAPVAHLEPRFERRYVTRSGETVNARVSLTVVHSDGIPAYKLVVVEDRTDAEEAIRLVREQQERLQMILDATEVAAWEIDLETGEYANSDNVRTVFGTDGPGPVTFTDFLDLVHPDDLEVFLGAPLAEVADGARDDLFTFDYRLRAADGTYRRTRSRGRVVRDAAGRPRVVQGTTVDIHEHYVAEQARLEQAEVHRRTIDAARDGFVGVDRTGHIREWNPAAAAIFGWTRQEAIGRPFVGTVISPGDRTAADVGLLALGAPGEPDPVLPGRLELVGIHRDGRELPIELSFVTLADGAGDTHVRAFVRDITERVAYEQQLTDRALTDSLTGLPNRMLFLDRLGGAIARLERGQGLLAVLFIDVDRFKMVNDSLGHAVGDELLACLGERLRRELRPSDTVARFGGDEFVVLCEGLGAPEEAVDLAERILAGLEAPLPLSGRRHHVEVSIGIAPVADTSSSPEDVVRNADTAMYRAKEQGGGTYEIFNHAIRARALARLTLEDDLRSALGNEEFEVWYQPVLSMDEAIVGAEALVRWRHPERGLLPPGEFIPVAEQTRLIGSLGLYVLARACNQLAAWHRAGHADLQLAVNLSGLQLEQRDLPSQVRLILEANRVAPERLCLEITESMFMEESRTVWACLQELRQLGVQLAVDDFGTGYSSLLYLRRFPLQFLKLDRTFVAGLGQNPADRAIVGSMIDLAHALGLTAIAEGVERREQLDALRGLGCDQAQGFLWSEPLPADELSALLPVRRTAPAEA